MVTSAFPVGDLLMLLIGFISPIPPFSRQSSDSKPNQALLLLKKILLHVVGRAVTPPPSSAAILRRAATLWYLWDDSTPECDWSIRGINRRADTGCVSSLRLFSM
ncbi:hypothetical protein CEXT_346861 [Caerostris extrusa]|uniref:Secreted protein n=1 Tax=Caerostris extrusa TaxID=172846 RepID=A0AAV4V803_CAEEX|nr:hypothetical protein CEXT_346861 [Caerostris extrusa]